MTPEGLRERLGASYRFDAARGIFVAHRAESFAYSDGAAAEAYVAQAIREVRDVAVGSTELAARIRDWPSKYHLSPARQNLLRPIEPALRGLVLEIGAGCGAITRFLGESGATVLAVEGSPERAAIAASRCRDLPNVAVVCDNFANLDLPLRFDVVTLIGVLEYSRMFLAGEDPVQAMLAKAASFLPDAGLLVLAIENQLGLKYLAGAKEDHLDIAFSGVIDQYGPRTPVTFGEAELRARLAKAGFGAVQGFYPFPDYKLPAVVVTESGFRDATLNVSDLVATSMRRHDPREGPYAYSESLARGVFVRNGLGSATANSFLFLAGRTQAAREAMPDPSVLAFSYSMDRDRAYAKEARIVSTEAATRVLRRRLYEGAVPTDAPLAFHPEDEVYVRGEVVYRALERAVARPGWSLDDVVAWMRPLADFFMGRAQAGLLPPAFFDCTAFNVIRRESDGALVPFDLEWGPPDKVPLTVARAVFRSLWNSLARVDDVAAPAAATPTDVCTLCLAAMDRLGYRTDESQALEWIRGEHAFSGPASGMGIDLPAVIPRFGVGGGTGHDGEVPRFTVQVYYYGEGEGPSEELSVKVTSEGRGDRIFARLALPSRGKRYARLRLDPMDIPAIFRLVRVAVTDAKNGVVWETRQCRPPDFEALHQIRDLSSLVPSASGAVWLSEGIDPYFDLALPAEALARLDGGGAVEVEMARLDGGQRTALHRLTF